MKIEDLETVGVWRRSIDHCALARGELNHSVATSSGWKKGSKIQDTIRVACATSCGPPAHNTQPLRQTGANNNDHGHGHALQAARRWSKKLRFVVTLSHTTYSFKYWHVSLREAFFWSSRSANPNKIIHNSNTVIVCPNPNSTKVQRSSFLYPYKDPT